MPSKNTKQKKVAEIDNEETKQAKIVELKELLSKGQKKLEEKDYDSAVEMLSEALCLSNDLYEPFAPESFDAHVKFGVALFNSAVEEIKSKMKDECDSCGGDHEKEILEQLLGRKAISVDEATSADEANSVDEEESSDDESGGSYEDGSSFDSDEDEIENMVSDAWTILEVAKETCEKQLEKVKEDADIRKWKLLMAEPIHFVGRVLILNGHEKKAKDEFAKSIAIKQQYSNDEHALATEFYEIGNAFDEMISFADAKAYFEKALESFKKVIEVTEANKGEKSKIDELNAICKEIQGKIDTAEEDALTMGIKEELVDMRVKATSTGDALVNDVSHLIKRCTANSGEHIIKMFEGLLADILNRILGDYIGNLDAKQLNVGIWGGDLQLKNLELKESALDTLDLPLKLKFGCLDKLVLKIPWTNLYNEPVIADVEGLYVIIVPNRAVAYDEEKAKKLDFENKMKALSRVDELKKQNKKPTGSAPDDSFTEKLIAQIIKNLQVKIKSIHVRYEDKFTNGLRPFAVGATLKALSLETTDESWKATIHKETLKIFYKLVKLDNLAVYWNSFSKMVGDSDDRNQIREELSKSIASKDYRPADYIYVLEPMEMEAHLKLNQRPETDGSNWKTPKVDLGIDLEQLVLCLVRQQYKDALKFIETFDRFQLSARYLKYRPHLNVYKGHYREWWNFAYNVILNEQVRRRRNNWSWKRMKSHRQLRSLPIGSTTILEEAEHTLDLFNLTLAREQAELQIDRRGLKRLDDQKEQGWTDWARSWWYGESKPQKLEKQSSDIVSQFERAMNPQEKAKFYAAIDYQENMPPTDYPKSYVERRIRADFHRILLRLEDSLELRFSRISSTFEQRPSAYAMQLKNSVKSLTAIGCGQMMFEILHCKANWALGLKSEELPHHNQEKVQKANLTINSVHLKLSPAVSYLYSIISDRFLKDKGSETQRSAMRQVLAEYEDYWVEKPFSRNDYWWFKETAKGNVNTTTEESALSNMSKAIETLDFSIDKFKITVESESNNTAELPMVLFDATLNGSAHNWTEKLAVDAIMEFEMSYYNEAFNVWEPIVEPVQRGLGNWERWQLNAKIRTHAENEAVEDNQSKRAIFMPKMTIELNANEILNITLTKSFIHSANKVSEAFKKAFDLGKQANSYKPRVLPGAGAYLVMNQTGLDIHLISSDTLKVRNNKPQTASSYFDLSYIGTEPTSSVYEEAHHSTELVLQILGTERIVDVQRAETRCIPLNKYASSGRQWNLVVDTEVVNARRVITLKSMVQFVNHLDMPIEIYSADDSNSLKSCGIAKKDNSSPLYVPTNLLYTSTGDFFIRPTDGEFEMSSNSFSWHFFNEETRKILSCSGLTDEKQKMFYVDLVVSTDDVLTERGKRTSEHKSYTVHLYSPLQFRNLLPIDINLTSPIECVVKAGQDIPLNVVTDQVVKFWIDYNGKHEAELKMKEVHEDLEILTFAGSHSELNLGIHFSTEYLCRECSVYAPYWIVNSTGRSISYVDASHVSKSKKCVTVCKGSKAKKCQSDKYEIDHDPDVNPVFMPYPTTRFKTKNKAHVRVGESKLSDEFPLDTVANAGRIVCIDDNDQEYEMTVDVQLSNSRLTKIVTFTSFYLLQNTSKFNIELQENGSDTWITVPAETCVSFWPVQDTTRKFACVRYCGQEEESVMFPFTENFEDFCPTDDKYLGFYVTCTITESSSIINIDGFQPGMVSALLINDTDLPIKFVQQGLPDTESSVLLPRCQQYFNFTDFERKERAIEWVSKDYNGVISLVSDNLTPYEPRTDSKTQYYWASFLNGRQRTVFFTQEIETATVAKETYEIERMDQQIELNLQGIGVSLVNNLVGQEILYMGVSSSGISWQQQVRARYRPFVVKATERIEKAYQEWVKNGQKLGLVDAGESTIDFSEMLLRRKKKSKGELKIRRSFQNGLYLMYRRSAHQTQIHMKVNHLQIDNQLPACVFPRALSMVPPPRSVIVDSEPKPFAEFSFISNQSEHSNILQIKYLRMLIQEFDIQLDSGLVEAVLALFDSDQIGVPFTPEMFKNDLEMAQPKLQELIVLTKASKQKSFYHDLHISPIMMHLSYSKSEFSRRKGQDPRLTISRAGHQFFSVAKVFAKSLGVTMTEVRNVVFKLSYFELNHTFYNKHQLQQGIINHYKKQFIRQLYVLVLGLEVLGNPYGLVVDLASGVQDFFYQPFRGAIQGPEDFAEGLEIGLVSLFSNSVGGLTGAASRITGSVGKGIAMLTMDEDFQRRRQEALNRQPQNFTESMARGVEGFGTGIYEGITGVVTKPIAGARSGGVGGFVSGIGRGVIGVVARPLAGTFDFASNTFGAVNSFTSESKAAQPLRPARYIKTDRIIRPYSFYDASGYKIFRDTDKGSFADSESFIVHAFVSESSVFIVTNRRVLLSTRNALVGSWSTSWSYEFDKIQKPVLFDNGVKLTLKTQKKGFLGIGDDNGKCIIFSDQTTASIVNAKLMTAYEDGE